MKASIELPFPLLRLLSLLLLKPLFQFEVRGQANLAETQGRAILAGNHTGLLDSLMVIAACPRYFQFLMTEEVFTWGLIGKLVRYANMIPLSAKREKRALLSVVQALRNEQAICIFPEGRLTEDGELLPFNEGAAFLQEKSVAPIIPFAIHGGFEAWPIGQPFPKFRKLIIQFGPPILPDSTSNRDTVTHLLRQRIASMKHELEQSPCSLPAKLPPSPSMQ